MKMRCDFHFEHDLSTDVPAGRRCSNSATHRIRWEDGRYSFGCDDHLDVDPTATVKPMSIVPLKVAP